MEDFKGLIVLIQDAIDKFNGKIPGIQKKLLDKIRIELKALSLDSQGNIKIASENVRKIADIKSKLLDIVLTPDYVKAVADLVKTFDQIATYQNQYFNTLQSGFTPPDIVQEIKDQAIKGLVENMTERGIDANVLSGVEDILRTNITTGGSYSQLQAALENNILNNDTGEGSLLKYAKQITTDAVNQYSRQYTQIISSGLDYEWFYYAGSTLTTTRPFCLACVKKRYIHVSEFPALLKGDFQEFEDFDGKLYKGLPAGMYPDTTPSNFQTLAGGYNCGHQLRPVHESQVPVTVRELIYATAAYHSWKAAA